MNTKLFFIRKTKNLFERFKLHIFINPFSNIFLQLVYLSKLSKWINDAPKPSYNDFYCKKVDYGKRMLMHKYILEKEELENDIDYLEFGVASGVSFKWWVENNKNTKSKFYGFDTFTGLPEDFGVFKKNDYSQNGKFPPINDERVEFWSGMFQKSLPKFLNKFSWNRKVVIHMDADLYSSTLYVLTSVARYLKEGDIIIFDEFGVPTHEFRAFVDFFSAYPMKYELLAATNNYLQIAIKIIEVK
ncbi:MAG: class I SAM-dependent methyltransferase [Ignavibacteriales bacterium]|nr:class I SAM-dependent methyltransferase [Ignavibacteriales bacterium]